MPNAQIDPTKPLADTQREAFAVRCASGEAEFSAYKAVFGKGNKVQAFMLREEDGVDARIAFLQESRASRMLDEAAEQVSSIKYGKDEAMAEASAAFTLAMTLQDPRAAVAAVGLKAKLSGLLSDAAAPIRSLRDLPLGAVEALLREAQDRRLARLLASGETGDILDVTPQSH